MPTLDVRFNQDGRDRRKKLPLAEGERLLDRILHEGVPLSHDCGGVLACASCLVIVREGLEALARAEEDEQDILDKAAANTAGARLSCCVIVRSGDLVVEIPQMELPAMSPRPDGTGLPVTLSDRAAKHFATQLAKKPGIAGVRLSVRPAGCSGMRYQVDYAGTFGTGDTVFVSGGIRIAVDPQSLPFVAGTHLDFSAEGLASRLRFDNPNMRQTCGCGESFGV
jgi:iron-sulfur cluster assembly protein